MGKRNTEGRSIVAENTLYGEVCLGRAELVEGFFLNVPDNVC